MLCSPYLYVCVDLGRLFIVPFFIPFFFSYAKDFCLALGVERSPDSSLFLVAFCLIRKKLNKMLALTIIPEACWPLERSTLD